MHVALNKMKKIYTVHHTSGCGQFLTRMLTRGVFVLAKLFVRFNEVH